MNKTSRYLNRFSPFEIAKKIDGNEFVLPRFQRELDWKPDRIAKLFDSLYKGFSINLVVLWEPREPKQNYLFIRNYEYNMHNSKDEKDNSEGKTFVLDGQQRFEALFIGLYGTYKERNGVVKELYFYLGDSEKLDDFVFISDNEYKERNIDRNFFIKVSDLRKFIKCKKKESIIDGLIDDVNKEIDLIEFLKSSSDLNGKEKNKKNIEIESYKEKIKAIKKSKNKIYRLYNSLKEKSIMYYKVSNKLADDMIEELFVRMNTGGVQLSNPEIILSKLVTKWQTKNARGVINGLIDDINHIHIDKEKKKYVYDYSIGLDFIMKSFLFLLDEQDISFKLKNILNNELLIKKMEDNFDNIGYALKKAFAFINKYGFNHCSLRSNNAVIPIAYVIYKNRKYYEKKDCFLLDDEYKALQKSMIKWLCATILSNFWSGLTDNGLIKLRETINSYKGDLKNLDFYQLMKSNTDLKSITLTSKDVNNRIMNYTYNSSETYSILCVLYLNNDKFTNYIRSRYDVDHIFPKSKFKDEFFDEMKIREKDRDFYRDNFNLLPNLQLLTEKENQEDKRNKYFDVWINEFYKTDTEINDVLSINYIEKVYKFNQFRVMFNKRKKTLSEELLRIFGDKEA